MENSKEKPKPKEWVHIDPWNGCLKCNGDCNSVCPQCVDHRQKENQRYEEFKKHAKSILQKQTLN